MVGSFKDLFEINYFQLNDIHNYIVYIVVLYISIVLYITSIVLNKREKGLELFRCTLMKFWTLCNTTV